MSDVVTAAASGRDPGVGLAAVAALRELLEAVQELQVARARDQGWSWRRIAGQLRTSRRAARRTLRRRAT